MSLKLLREADYILNSCGRPVPPEGYRFVDLPRVIPFHTVITSAEGVPGSTPAQFRVSNNANTLFLVRGIMFDGPVAVRIKWPTGRFLSQNPIPFPAGLGPASPFGKGGTIFALNRDQPIDPDGRIAIETSGSSAGTVDIQFWGVLRYLLKETANGSRIAAGQDTSCIVGYPAGLLKPAPLVTMVDDPVETLEDRLRYRCSPNLNIMAPEWLLGNQCTAETPEGYEDESFTFFSGFIVVPLNTQSYNNNVIIPGADDVIIKHVTAHSVADAGAAGTPVFSIRLPNGYSVTGGDLVPGPILGFCPVFPTLRISAGGRLIVDVADNQTAGAGNITSRLEFDAVKRRRLL